MVNSTEPAFKLLVGDTELLPIMNPVQAYFPSILFASLAYQMFSFLFGWHDTNWDQQAKKHYFQFTPRPTSTQSIVQLIFIF